MLYFDTHRRGGPVRRKREICVFRGSRLITPDDKGSMSSLNKDWKDSGMKKENHDFAGALVIAALAGQDPATDAYAVEGWMVMAVEIFRRMTIR